MDPSPKKLRLMIPGLHQEGMRGLIAQIMRLSEERMAWSQASVTGGLFIVVRSWPPVRVPAHQACLVCTSCRCQGRELKGFLTSYPDVGQRERALGL